MSFINEKPESRFALYNHIEKNEIVLKTNAVRTCSEYCFKNLKTDFIVNEENLCLTRCYRKYLDSAFMGEQIYNLIAEKKISVDFINKGKFEEFTSEVKGKMDL